MCDYGSKYHLCKLIDGDFCRCVFDGMEDISVELISPEKLMVPNKYDSRKHEKSLETYIDTFETELREIFGSGFTSKAIRAWWCQNGGKRPTLDMICPAVIDGNPGLILVEAKAHKNECIASFKKIKNNASDKSKENSDEIRKCIKEQLEVLGGVYGGYYQIANRIAYANKIRDTYNIPVLLLFLGFIGDTNFESDYYKNDGDFIKKINTVLDKHLQIDMNNINRNKAAKLHIVIAERNLQGQ